MQKKFIHYFQTTLNYKADYYFPENSLIPGEAGLWGLDLASQSHLRCSHVGSSDQLFHKESGHSQVCCLDRCKMALHSCTTSQPKEGLINLTVLNKGCCDQ